MKKIILFLLLSIAGYGQIVPSGQEQDFDYGIRNTESQLDDNAVFLTVQDATGVQGKSTASVWAKKIYVDNADAKKQFLSTGLLKNGLLQANVNTTLFDITAGTGIISNFDNPDASTSDIIIFPAFTGILSPYLTTSNITYVAINSVPAVVMQASPFTDSQRRDLIILGAIVHSNLSTINTINNISAPANADTNQLHDLMEAIGALNISGNKYSANGANLSLNKSAGDIFKLGINFANNWKDPHKLTIDAQTLLTLRYRTQNGTEGTDVTVLNPSVYDLNNVLTAVPSNRFSIQTVTLFQSGITRVQYGQNTYATMAEAEAAINTRAYVVEPNIALNGIARAYIILKNNTTSLQNTSDAKIVEAQKFGGSTSGGVALTNASIIAALGFTPENVANKQNSLAVDGSGMKYPTVDAVNKRVAFINVKEFGATGNGVTNDAPAIAAAYAALPATGGVLYFPNGAYNSTAGFAFIGNNITLLGENQPRVADDLNSLIGGTILKGGVLIDGNNIRVENIGVDNGITYSNTYKSGIGGDGLVIHKVGLSGIIKNINVKNVTALIRIGNFSDAQAAFHAILLEGIQFGSAENITGVGGWYGIVIKASDFNGNGLTGRENDNASIYLKSNIYAPAARVTLTNLIVSNFTARGFTGVNIQSSDAEMETVSVSNVTVRGGLTAFRVEAETTNPVVGFSLNGLTARNIQEGISIRGAVYAPVISNCSIFTPVNEGLRLSQNSTSQNAIEVLASNIRIVPSATTVYAINLDSPVFKGIFSNINVAGSDGVTIETGSVMNLQSNSDISNYVGTLKRGGVTSDVSRFRGGGLTTSLANINTSLNTRQDFADSVFSIGYGFYQTPWNPFIQSYNNNTLTATRLDLNPFGGEIHAPTATPGTNTTQIATMAALQVVARPYKVYTALLSQTGTNAPTAIVQENTIGSIVWGRTVAGNYFATLSGAYTTDKTTVFITNGASNATYIHGSAVSTTNVNVITLDDGQIDRATIEIRVYN